MNAKTAWATEKDLLQKPKTNEKREEKEKHKSQEEGRKNVSLPSACPREKKQGCGARRVKLVICYKNPPFLLLLFFPFLSFLFFFLSSFFPWFHLLSKTHNLK